jgi:hypothetical protein
LTQFWATAAIQVRKRPDSGRRRGPGSELPPPSSCPYSYSPLRVQRCARLLTLTARSGGPVSMPRLLRPRARRKKLQVGIAIPRPLSLQDWQALRIIHRMVLGPSHYPLGRILPPLLHPTSDALGDGARRREVFSETVQAVEAQILAHTLLFTDRPHGSSGLGGLGLTLGGGRSLSARREGSLPPYSAASMSSPGLRS